MTQSQQIERMLQDQTFVCGQDFLKAFIPEYRSRINLLRKSGTPVYATKCTMHKHKSGMLMWSLKPSQSSEIDQGGVKEKVVSCCTSQLLFRFCERNCETLKSKQGTLI